MQNFFINQQIFYNLGQYSQVECRINIKQIFVNKYQLLRNNKCIANKQNQLVISKVEMQNTLLQRNQLLSPYKTLGLFALGHACVAQSTPFNIAIACEKSFKIYSQDLAIKVVSPCFPEAIKTLATYNEYTYVYAGQTLYKMQYSHLVDSWDLGKSQILNKQQCSILLYDKVVFLSEGKKIYTINQDLCVGDIQSQILYHNYAFEIQSMVHPIAYINKILIWNRNNLVLINPVTHKQIYEFKKLLSMIEDKASEIDIVKATPLVDIIVIGLKDTHQIVVANIKKDCVVFTMKQKNPITTIAFSQSEPYMATGDDKGTIILWNLEKKRIEYRIEDNSTQISHLFFNKNTPLLTAISCPANTLRQYRINTEDSNLLSLYRQRCGSTTNIKKISMANDKQLCYYTDDGRIVYSSLYTHCNNYVLPRIINNGYNKVIGSELPYHIIAYNYSIQLYKERTLYCEGSVNQKASMKHREYPQIGKVSISGFLIIAMKNRIIKMRVHKPLKQEKGAKSSKNTKKNVGKLEIITEWQVSNISAFELFNENNIFVFTSNGIYIYDFNSPTLVSYISEATNCSNSVLNHQKNLIAFQKVSQNKLSTIDIWDMNTLKCGRSFAIQENRTTCLTFTSDNRYLLSAHQDHYLHIWSMVDNVRYYSINLGQKLECMTFTPDNSYLLTAYKPKNNLDKNGMQICIWNNYIGRITTRNTHEDIEDSNKSVLKFTPQIKTLPKDYRRRLVDQSTLVKKQQKGDKSSTLQEQFIQMLNSLQVQQKDSEVPYYNFKQVSKWLPLVFYDQIRERNTIAEDSTDKGKLSGIPFFLDFNNITQEKQKLHQEIKDKMRENKKKQTQKRDHLLHSEEHAINFVGNTDIKQQYQKTFKMLSKLSIAQVDYQLRRYLMQPMDSQINLSKMFLYIWENSQRLGHNSMVYNVLLIRYLELLGTDLLREEVKQSNEQLLRMVTVQSERVQQTVQRCAAILENRA